MFLKLLIPFSVCLLLVLGKIEIPSDLQEVVQKVHNTCLTHEGLTEDDFKTFDMSMKNTKLMCYIKCLLLETKWITSDEVLQYDYIKQTVHPDFRDILIPQLDKCGQLATGNASCEKSYNFYYCVHLSSPENWPLI